MRNIFSLAVYAAAASFIVGTSASAFAADALPSPAQASPAPAAAQGAMHCHPKGQASKPGSASEAPIELQRAPAGSLRKRIKQVPRPARQMTEVQPA